MFPRTGDSLLAEAKRADAICVIGDRRAAFYADTYVDRPDLARPFFAVAYAFAELSCSTIFVDETIHADVARSLQNEGRLAPGRSREISGDDRLRRAVTQGLLVEWRHGLNMTLDPIVVFVVGERDVTELANSNVPDTAIETAVAERLLAFDTMLASLVENGFGKLYVHGLATNAAVSTRDRAVCAAFDRGFASIARERGATFLDANANAPIVDQLLRDRIARRGRPLEGASRIAALGHRLG